MCGRPISPGAARREGLHDVAAETPVVERVPPEALRGLAPLPVAHRLLVMEVVERNAYDGPAESAQSCGEFVGEGALAGSVRAVDSDPRTFVAVGRGNLAHDTADDLAPLSRTNHQASLPNREAARTAPQAPARPTRGRSMRLSDQLFDGVGQLGYLSTSVKFDGGSEP